MLSQLLLLIFEGLLVLFGGILAIIALISMMTMMAVAEERGEDDPSVKHWRRFQPLVAVCLIPAVVLWVLGFHWVYTMPFVVGAIALLVWNLRRVKGPVNIRRIILGTTDKDPDYFDIQLTRNMLYFLFLTVVLILTFSNLL